MARVLIITNSSEIGPALTNELKRDEQTVMVADRAGALDVAFKFSPEVLIVDAQKDASPAKVCRQIRREDELKDLPLIVIVAPAHLADLSPKIGLDDFVLGQPRPGEMAGRVRLALWRTNRAADEDLLRVRDMVMNLASYEVTVRGVPVELTYKEYELLKFLAMNPGRVYTRENLLNRVWGFDFYGGTRTVDVHIRRIRSKIGDQHESLIQTVRNVGYRFSENVREAPPPLLESKIPAAE
ncbi:MAG TPA: response regulator transcription factor [Armatimonadota bacterium]|nr:response regulator transcription factor [Armatimonadota bacterium]